MLEGIHFSYDGVKSKDMGLINVSVNGGMFEETFLPSVSIEEEKVVGRNMPYFKRVERDPLEFNLTFAFEDGYDSQKIREVARWLCQDYYKPFYTTDNEDRVFYCMMTGDSSLFHNGIKQGYITLTMRCKDSYSYSKTQVKDSISFGNQKVVNTFVEDTFNSSMGTQNNVKINSENNLEINEANITWDMLSGKKWSDLI